jgi:hypothetical protein
MAADTGVGISVTTEDENVKHLKTLIVAFGVTSLGVTSGLVLGAQAEDKPPSSADAQAAPAKCLEALVNPVTGYTLCVNPRGAPVEQASPPKAPCKPRAHDQETGTVYEHWSAC